jgi:hypothetical protein
MPDVTLADASTFLARGPDTFRALAGGLDPAWTERRPTPESWSTFEVGCHLAYIEAIDWLPRVRIILEHGEARPFDPVDHGLQVERFVGLATDDVIERFAELRTANLADLARLDLEPADLDRLGTHPTLGPVTLGQLLASWVVHDLNHFAQVEAALAHRYRTDVGPWRAFLGIVDREP